MTATCEQSRPNLAVFRACFAGLEHVYGTRDLRTGRTWQVKGPVTDAVLTDHLEGRQHVGVFLLIEDRTRALVVDFDTQDLWPVREFMDLARQYDLPAYVERSKSKGHHVWMFFPESGVPASKARAVVLHMLAETGQPHTEVFPKQNRLDDRTPYGAFIFLPLFGVLVPRGRSVFVGPEDLTKPYPDQWALLQSVERIEEAHLDALIEINEITPSATTVAPVPAGRNQPLALTRGLPPCARRMLTEGVRCNQRVSCFRLAVDLKGTGLPYEHTVAVLYEWARRIRPVDRKRIITPLEIKKQTSYAYDPKYHGYGCDDAAVQPFCDASCPVRNRHSTGAPPETEGPSSSERNRAMSNSIANRPIKEFRVRNLSLAIWQNGGTRDGRPITLHSITLNKRYQDQGTGEWKDSSSFFPDDLPRLRLLLDKAYEHILLRDTSPASNPDEPGAEFPPSE